MRILNNNSLYAIRNTITDTVEIDIKGLSYNITLILIVRCILIIEEVCYKCYN